ncbi:Arc family DNA-binding protein [Leclercia sp. J807]|nr:Arc family DNA-binding protein [Leclercia sp. J807]
MSREDPQLRIRLPIELKEKVEASAKENNRSMNAEIVQILQDALASGDANTAVLNHIGIKEMHKILDKVIEETLGKSQPNQHHKDGK